MLAQLEEGLLNKLVSIRKRDDRSWSNSNTDSRPYRVESWKKGLEMTRKRGLLTCGKAIACMAAIVLAVSVALGGAQRAIALQTGGMVDDKANSITVHKLESQYVGGPGMSGTEADKPAGAHPVPGAKFKLVKLNAKAVEGLVDGVSGLDNKTPERRNIDNLDSIDASGPGNSNWAKQYTDPTDFFASEKTTDVDGAICWDNLSFGYYLLVETDAPTGYQDVSSVDPSIVTLPFVQADSQGGAPKFVKDVHVYPKNRSTTVKQSSKAILEMKNGATSVQNVTEGTIIDYRISFDTWDESKLGPSADSKWASAVVRDFLPINGKGSPVFDLQKGSEKVFLKLQGKSDPVLLEGGFSKYFNAYSVKNSSDLTQQGVKGTGDVLEWETTSDGALAKAVKEINEKNPSNKVEAIFFDFKVQANKLVTGAIAESGNRLVNKYDVGTKDMSGAEVIKPNPSNPSEGDGAGHIGMSFVKTTATDAGEANLDVPLKGAKFLVAESEKAYKEGKWLGSKKANAKQAFVVESDGNGKVGLSALDLDDLVNVDLGTTATGTLSNTDGMAAKDGEAVKDLKDFIEKLAPGATKEYSFYVYETQAPNGYRSSDKVYEVPIAFTKANDGTISWSEGKSGVVHVPNYTYNQAGSGAGEFPLPNTGGAGAALIVGVGLILMTGGATLFILNRKKSKRQ